MCCTRFSGRPACVETAFSRSRPDTRTNSPTNPPTNPATNVWPPTDKSPDKKIQASRQICRQKYSGRPTNRPTKMPDKNFQASRQKCPTNSFKGKTCDFLTIMCFLMTVGGHFGVVFQGLRDGLVGRFGRTVWSDDFANWSENLSEGGDFLSGPGDCFVGAGAICLSEPGDLLPLPINCLPFRPIFVFRQRYLRFTTKIFSIPDKNIPHSDKNIFDFRQKYFVPPKQRIRHL